MKQFFIGAVALFAFSNVNAQELKTKANWFNLDYEKDGIRGMGVERAYEELLKGRTSQRVIVGVIDSGVDINHEDLRVNIWVNEDEIPNNGIDDDNNGFIDDVNGWDFIGAADGQDIKDEQLESTRLLKKYQEKFGDNPKKRFLRKYKDEYNDYISIKKQRDEQLKEAKQYLPMYQNLYDNFVASSGVLKGFLKIDELTGDLVNSIDEAEADRDVRKAKQFYLQMVQMGATQADIKDGVEHFEGMTKYSYNIDYSPRDIIGDDLTKLEYGKYGNNEVTGPDAKHGTHVAGIIGAVRNNNVGTQGVADNVKIMVVRCVPNGDERDKDVANAIRYAVDNGAKVINMSFGKSRSPEKEWVDEAIQYAMDKDVLLVAASGNDNDDIDAHVHYPSKFYNNGKVAENFISVGATNFEDGTAMVADFSNYGKKTVDVFAPGMAIYSTVPDSKYQELQGTSMASPAVAGVAALLKSYFPTLTAKQLKEVISSSVTNLSDFEVRKPGSDDIIKFGDLSVTGGIVNAYEAVKAAIEFTEKQ
jgi:subtilisin family serine protease